MPLIRTLSSGGVLQIEGWELCEVAEALPSLGVESAPIEAVEHLFNCLA